MEGWPLALTWLAPQLALFTPDELTAALKHGLDHLLGDNADLPARHQHWRATFAPTWHNLNAPLQADLVRLAELELGFSVSAAEQAGVSWQNLLKLWQLGLVGRIAAEHYALPNLWRLAVMALANAPAPARV